MNKMEALTPGTFVSEADQAAMIGARVDRLPGSRGLWSIVLLISLGGLLEFYELSLTGFISPGLFRSGVFHPGSGGLFGMTDQAIFAFATFMGLFVGTSCCGMLADKLGRRAMFTFTTLWYGPATLIMAFQESALGVDVWRFIAAIGLGVELITIDAYLSEIVPKRMRGRAFAVMNAVSQLGIPVAAIAAWQVIEVDPLGFAGWRWMLIGGAASTLTIWMIRAVLPDSPRWLVLHGNAAEAERIMGGLERRIEAETGRPLPEPIPEGLEAPGESRFAELWRPPFRRRTIMLSVFQFCQTIGFYGFGNWLPALVAAQGIAVQHSLFYSVLITIAAPIAPLCWTTIADRVERKWQLVGAAAGTACLGLLFAVQSSATVIVVLGILIVFSNSLLGYAHHAYSAELFPTRIRARAVGFVYSWSRLSTAFSSLMIGFLLSRSGSTGVFVFIAVAMMGVVVSIGVFGPRTRGRSLEEISH